jgi:uncharacterized cupin superfamily protein
VYRVGHGGGHDYRKGVIMGVIDLTRVPVKTGTIYPPEYAPQVAGRSSLRLGDAGGLTQFGVNIVILAPGAKSSMRHWHLREDEFVMVTQGECVLMQDAGETVMRAGDCAAFPAGVADGHCLINRTEVEARFLVVGTKAGAEVATYSDVDLVVEQGPRGNVFRHKDGRPYVGPDQR